MNLLSTLFYSREKLLSQAVAGANAARSFPTDHAVVKEMFFSACINSSLLVSGGTEDERSSILIGLLQRITGPVMILSNDNPYLSPDMLEGYQVHVDLWPEEQLPFSKAELLSLLYDKENPDTLVFFSLAFEVLEMTGQALTIRNLSQINWLDTDWQRRLLAMPDKERALDLIRRFDKSMAEKVPRALCRLEHLTRSLRGNTDATVDRDSAGLSLYSFGSFRKNVWVKYVHGSSSDEVLLALDFLKMRADMGDSFTVVLDDVHAVRHPLIAENYKNVPLVLSLSDMAVCCESGMRITKRSCNLCFLKHDVFSSARLISDTYFGDLEQVLTDTNSGYTSQFLQPRARNYSVTLRKGREPRLKPEIINRVPYGTALVSLKNGTEGYMPLSDDGRIGVFRRRTIIKTNKEVIL